MSPPPSASRRAPPSARHRRRASLQISRVALPSAPIRSALLRRSKADPHRQSISSVILRAPATRRNREVHWSPQLPSHRRAAPHHPSRVVPSEAPPPRRSRSAFPSRRETSCLRPRTRPVQPLRTATRPERQATPACKPRHVHPQAAPTPLFASQLPAEPRLPPAASRAAQAQHLRPSRAAPAPKPSRSLLFQPSRQAFLEPPSFLVLSPTCPW